MQGTQVQSLVRELDPTCHTMWPKKKKKKATVSAADGASKGGAAVTDEGKMLRVSPAACLDEPGLWMV